MQKIYNYYSNNFFAAPKSMHNIYMAIHTLKTVCESQINVHKYKVTYNKGCKCTLCICYVSSAITFFITLKILVAASKAF